MAARKPRRAGRRLVPRAVVFGTGTVVVLVAGAAVAEAAMSSPAAYRLAPVTTGSPDQALTVVGTIEPDSQSTLSFPISGRVATVAIRPGAEVAAGQLLASLDTTALSAKMADARSGVASAEAKLDADRTAQDTASSSNSSDTSQRSSGDPGLGGLQKALLAARRGADTALGRAKAALARATEICSAVGAPAPLPPSGTPSETPSATPSGTPSAAPSATPTPTPTSGATIPAPGRPGRPACHAAETQALAWENTTYQDEREVAADESTLNSALTKAAASTSKSSSSSGSKGGGRSSGPPTAEQLDADQATVDSAEADQQVAQQNLDAAKLLSPAAGTVRSVTLTVGDQVSARSTTENIVISGPGGVQAVVDVPVSAMAGVAPGQRATVIPDGSSTTLSATVTSIAVMPLDGSGGGVTVPVTISIDGGTAVPDGSTATVALLAGDAQGSTTTVVPTSAIVSRGRGYAVRVDKDGTLTTVPVTIGASGPIYTQITKGLTAGQLVVLADLTTPLPTSTNLRGLGGGGGGGGNRRGGG